ncbi:MAG TPA: hypothetical protein VJW20_14585 [Candidatus Angelobacter sp.]|nr:hypothetical protein [Candidatus Angelobacter sp.]
MTVAELFREAKLLPSAPVPWKIQVEEPRKGIYVVARVEKPTTHCERCDLPLRDPLSPNIKIDFKYEQTRWLPSEGILYIGKTDRPISTRLNEFYCHVCGHKRPHAGGQVVKLLQCNLWIYWAAVENPYHTEQLMIDIFERQAGKVPFANYDRVRRPRRVQLSN